MPSARDSGIPTMVAGRGRMRGLAISLPSDLVAALDVVLAYIDWAISPVLPNDGTDASLISDKLSVTKVSADVESRDGLRVVWRGATVGLVVDFKDDTVSESDSLLLRLLRKAVTHSGLLSFC